MEASIHISGQMLIGNQMVEGSGDAIFAQNPSTGEPMEVVEDSLKEESLDSETISN